MWNTQNPPATQAFMGNNKCSYAAECRLLEEELWRIFPSPSSLKQARSESTSLRTLCMWRLCNEISLRDVWFSHNPELISFTFCLDSLILILVALKRMAAEQLQLNHPGSGKGLSVLTSWHTGCYCRQPTVKKQHADLSKYLGLTQF